MKRIKLTHLVGLSLGIPVVFLLLVYAWVLVQSDGTCVTFTAEAYSCTFRTLATNQFNWIVLFAPLCVVPSALVIAAAYVGVSWWRGRSKQVN